MRVKLFDEGVRYPNGMYLGINSIELPVTEKIPLSAYTPGVAFGPDDVIGFVTDIVRENNSIYGELSVQIDTEFYDFSAFCTHVASDSEDKTLVTSARIRGVQVIPIDPFVQRLIKEQNA